MSRETGLRFGRALEPFAVGVAAAERQAAEHVHHVRQQAQSEIATIESAAMEAEQRLDVIEQQLQEVDIRVKRTSEERDQFPVEYSVPRGFMYIAIALVLLAGDVTILGGVLAKLLNLPVRDEASGLA